MTDDVQIPCPALAQYRKAADLTQPQLAERVHVSRRQLQRWEESGQAPEGRIQTLAQALGVTAVDLVRQTRPGPDRELSRLARRFLEACQAVREAQGPAAYRKARERVLAARPDLGALLPE
jgi:transcriptional regulator with XRE-family HTH domain